MPSLKAMAQEAQKGPKSSAFKQPSKSKQTVFKSTERVADSDIESETESESSGDSEGGSVIAPQHVPKANGCKKEPADARHNVENSEEDEDESEDDNEIEGGTEISSNDDLADRRSSGQSESGSDGSSNSESKSEEEHETDRAEETLSHVKEAIQGRSDTSMAIPIYTPPDDFTMLSESNDEKQKVMQVFSSSNLAGKQLWYITAPVSVPISAVKQVSLRDVQLGRPALSLNGHHYGFVEEQAGDVGNSKALIPDGKSTMYRVGQKAIDQTLHLQQIVQLPSFTTSAGTKNLSSQIHPTTPAAAEPPPRKQPEGLKMRFRPIGFGSGKTGTIGSSPSDTSSSTDTDADEAMEDAPLVTRQSLNLNYANKSLSEFVLNPATNHDDTSGSGEETNGSLPAAAKNSPALKQLPSSPSRPLKRKLSDFKNDDKISNTLNDYAKVNRVPLKTSKTKQTIPSHGSLSLNKANGNADAAKGDILPPGSSFDSTFPGEMVPGFPQRASETPSSSLITSKAKKVTPIPPPRQSSILPSSRENSGHLSKNLHYPLKPRSEAKGSLVPGEASDALALIKSATAGFEATPAKVSASRTQPENDNDKTLQDRIQAIDPEFSEKGRKNGLRRLKKNQASHRHEAQRRESMNSGASGTLDRSINASSPSRNALQLSSEIKTPPKPNINNVLSMDLKLVFTPNVEEASKISKHHSKSVILPRNGKIPKRSHETSTSSSSLPRKDSVILPPKFAGSLTR